MCGIAGLLIPRGAREAELAAGAAAMTAALAHRGPDGEGLWVDPACGIALGHRRLAIIDLSDTGRQPMHDASGRYVLSYNGEVYNHAELRAGLEARGARFRGSSDTEVLLELIAREGLEAALSAANGMFALALWDRATRRLALARDRFGQKPLAYGWCGGAFLFGSELRALEAFPGFDAPADRAAIAAMLSLGVIPAPLTARSGMRKLPPGTILTLAADAAPGTMPDPRPWWSARATVVGAEPFRGSAGEAEEALAALIADAVRLCRVADVPLGAFLSGGIDSTAVVAAMRDGGEAPRTFTIGFEDRGFDESRHAEAVARHLGTAHTTLVATDREALAIVAELGRLYDEPFADASAVPTVLVSRLARRHVTVALSGDGGDELFGGYTRYALFERAAAVHRAIPRTVRSVIAALARGALGILPPFRLARAALLLGLPDTGSLYRRFLMTGTEAGRLLPRASGVIAPPAWEEALGLRRAAMLHDTLAYLPDDILAKVDRASMSVGLEARVPLLDHRILAFAAALPEALLADSRGGKALLRRVVERAVPRALIERPKMGFGVPLARWLAGPLRDWAEALLDPGRLSSGLGFDARAVHALWARTLGGDRSAAAALWPVLMVEAWRRARESGSMCHGGHDRHGRRQLGHEAADQAEKEFRR